MSTRIIAFVAILLVVGAVGPAAAEEVLIAPSRAILVPADGSGLARIALQFDLSTLPTDPDRRIEQALLIWKPTGLTVDSTLAWSAHEIAADWTEAQVAAGTGAPAFSETEEDVWEITPFEAARDGETLIRFDLLSLVTGWADLESGNHGVLVVTEDVPEATLDGQLGSIVLRVWYGFGPGASE